MATRTYPFVSQVRLEAREEGRVEGRAEGLAEAVLAVFAQRGLEVDETARARIESCDDAEVLRRWLNRSFVVTTVGELFV